jgi:hypothetical protein
MIEKKNENIIVEHAPMQRMIISFYLINSLIVVIELLSVDNSKITCEPL